jgi:hypothetical protein
MRMMFATMLIAFGAAWAAAAGAPASVATSEVCVVVGAPGDDAYVPGFATAAKAWQDACARAGANCTVIGLDSPAPGAPTDHDRLQAWLQQLDPAAPTPVWIAYIGHGTYDGRDARLNLRGPNVTAAELADWLKPLRRPVIFIDGGSASAPFLPALSGPNRIIITATQSGEEVNYARFGEKFAQAVGNPAADIDQDGQTSLLEAFVTAARETQQFYDDAGRMASEHALIDDNGDGRGTPADWFDGTRLVKRPADGSAADGDVARLVALVPTAPERAFTPAQLQLRAAGEAELAQLRAQKDKLTEAEYYARLNQIFQKLMPLYVTPPTPPVGSSSVQPAKSAAPVTTPAVNATIAPAANPTAAAAGAAMMSAGGNETMK